MAGINGTTIVLDVDSNPIARLTDTTLNVDQDLPDASNKDDNGWADHINGQRSWSIDLDGHADMGDQQNVETLFDLIANRSNASIEFATSTNGDVKFTGTASLANMSLGAPNEDVATVSGSLTGKGALSKSSVS